ncbi:TP53BP2 isoform 5, partial [Pan troglodytes]
MFDVLQRFGSQRNEVRFFLRHERPPGRDIVSGPRSQDPSLKRNGVKVPGEYRRKENGVNSPRMDLTLAELQEMASRQQQQIEAQQQLLATKEQRLKFLKQQDQRQQQQVAEQEKLKRLKEIAENQEAKLKKVRALKGHVVSLVPESLSPEDVGNASTENSDMPAPSPGLDYEPEGVPDNSPNLQNNPEEPNPEAPHLLDVYLEEYPPYPPPPYPSGEPEGPGEDSVSMRPPEI